MADNLPALFLPTKLDPQLRQTLSGLNQRMRVLFDDRVTTSMLVGYGLIDDPNKETTSDSPDQSAPGVPTEIGTEKHENFIRLHWTNPSDKDLKRIDIYRKTSVASTPVLVAIITAPTAHYDDLDTDPHSSYWYYLICGDDSGNESLMAPRVDADNVVLKTEVPAPDEVVVAPWNQDDLALSCDPVDGFGVAGYLWMIVSGGAEVRSEITVDPSYTYTFSKNAADGLRFSVEVRLWTLDRNGAPSPDHATAVCTHTPPAIPTGVMVEITDIGFMVTWSAPSDSAVVAYEVGLNDERIGTVTDLSYLHKTLLRTGTYQFEVRSLNHFGQGSAWNTQTYTVNGPNAPLNFRVEVISNTVILYWDAPEITELPISEYEIRKGPWATPSDTYRKKGSFTILAEAQAGTYTYHVAAVDTAGNIGAHASLTATADDPPGYELNVEWRDDFFGGTSTNVQVMPDGTAYAPCYPERTIREQFIGLGTDEAPEFATIQAMIDAGHLFPVGPVPTTAEFFEDHDYEAVLSSSTVTSTLSRIDLQGTPGVTTYLAAKTLLGDAYVEEAASRVTRYNFRYLRDRFEFVSDGKAFSKLQLHTLRLDSKPVSESWKGTITDAEAGFFHAFDKNFADIKNIMVTIYDTGARQLGFAVDFDDIPYPTHCTIYLIDSTGKTTGTIGGIAEGYI